MIDGNKIEDPSIDYLKEPQFEVLKFKGLGDVDGDEGYIHIANKERIWSHRILALIYRCFRCVYVSFWFYFLPMVALLGSFYGPYIVNGIVYEKAEAAALTSV